MKLRNGLIGLVLAASLGGCASLKNTDIDVLYQPAHRAEVRHVETTRQAELLPWQVEYMKYGQKGLCPCVKKKIAPTFLGTGIIYDAYNFYGDNQRNLDFFYDVFKQDFRVDVLKVKF